MGIMSLIEKLFELVAGMDHVCRGAHLVLDQGAHNTRSEKRTRTAEETSSRSRRSTGPSSTSAKQATADEGLAPRRSPIAHARRHRHRHQRDMGGRGIFGKFQAANL